MIRPKRALTLLAAVTFGVSPGIVVGQAENTVPAVIVEDGVRRPWPAGLRGSLAAADSALGAAGEIIRLYQMSGYWYASVDSVVSRRDASRTFYVTRGRASRIGEFELIVAGGDPMPDGSMADDPDGWPVPGDPVDYTGLVERLNLLLDAYNDTGYPLAKGTIQIAPTDEEDVIDVFVIIERGTKVILTSLNLADDVRTSPRLVARLAGLKIGGAVTSFDADDVRRRLATTGLFDEVGEVRLETDVLGNGTLTVPLVETAPGNFDLVLGYQSRPTGRGEVVGNGHIILSNLFGGARTISMKLNRPSGRSSVIEADLVDPYILGSSLGAAVSFEGEQRDSTFSKQSYGGEVSYPLTSALEVFGSIDRTLARPGQAGLVIVGGRQLVPRSSSVFAGIGVRYANVDWPPNPRRGIEVATQFERGRKGIRTLHVVDTDTMSQNELLRQERLFAFARFYTPVVGSQVAAFGLDAEALRSGVYDDADLLSLGGALSLRGYNERQFRGRFVARAFAEYRYLLDRDSYAFVFADVGYVEPISETRGSFHPGFGLGIQFRSAVGLINSTYAVNTSDGLTRGKVHVGLSFEL